MDHYSLKKRARSRLSRAFTSLHERRSSASSKSQKSSRRGCWVMKLTAALSLSPSLSRLVGDARVQDESFDRSAGKPGLSEQTRIGRLSGDERRRRHLTELMTILQPQKPSANCHCPLSALIANETRRWRFFWATSRSVGMGTDHKQVVVASMVSHRPLQCARCLPVGDKKGAFCSKYMPWNVCEYFALSQI